MRVITPSLVLSLLVAGCGAASPPLSNTARVEPRPVRALVIVHGRMSYVMDSPVGQRHKAERALRASDLIHQLAAAGWEISYRFDDAAGDQVTIVAADGEELGRAELMALDGKPAPAEILARAR